MDLIEIQKTLHGLLPSLRERYGVGKLWIVGSRARGDHRVDSDLDVLVEFERRGISLFGFAGLELELEDQLGMKVDLVEEGAMKPRVETEIRKDAVLV